MDSDPPNRDPEHFAAYLEQRHQEAERAKAIEHAARERRMRRLFLLAALILVLLAVAVVILLMVLSKP